MTIFSEEIRYPEKGDKFFVAEGDQDEIAWLHKTFQKFGSYADGYQKGAISLIDTALEDKQLRDYHVYPAVFLIRHYLELRLKELIQGINYCNKQKKDFPATHNLETLWYKFKIFYSEIGDIEDERFQVIEALIKEMGNIDPISMAFRYPVDKEGKKTQKLDYVNLKNLRETFIRVSFVFDGVAMQIEHYVEMTEDMMHEVYQNYW